MLVLNVTNRAFTLYMEFLKLCNCNSDMQAYFITKTVAKSPTVIIFQHFLLTLCFEISNKQGCIRKGNVGCSNHFFSI